MKEREIDLKRDPVEVLEEIEKNAKKVGLGSSLQDLCSAVYKHLF